MITQHEKINLKDISSPHIVPCVQGDTGRSIVFDLADFTPPEGATATYYVQKPSGLAVYNTATIDGNSVLVDLTAESIAEVGDNYLQIRILDDEEVVTSFDCILAVAPFRGIDAIESGSESNIFDQAAAQALIDFEADAQEKAAETIATIPDDYTALSNSVTDLKNALNANHSATPGYILTATNEDDGIEWSPVGTPTDAQTATAVTAWLNAHPEATTTVQDGAITQAKLNSNLAYKIFSPPVNVLSLGVKNDGSEDCSTIINTATQSYELYFPSGTYRVDSPLHLRHSIYGAGASRQFVTTSPRQGSILKSYISGDNTVGVVMIDDVECDVERLHIVCNDVEDGILVNTTMSGRSIQINECVISNVSRRGINFDVGQNNNSRIGYIFNCSIFGKTRANSTGIRFSGKSFDSLVCGCEIMATQIGIDNLTGIIRISDTHIWTGIPFNGGDQNNWWGGTIGVNCYAETYLTNVYIDSSYVSIAVRSNFPVTLYNCQIWNDNSMEGSEKYDQAVFYIAPNYIGTAIINVDGLTVCDRGRLKQIFPSSSKNMVGLKVNNITVFSDKSLEPTTLVFPRLSHLMHHDVLTAGVGNNALIEIANMQAQYGGNAKIEGFIDGNHFILDYERKRTPNFVKTVVQGEARLFYREYVSETNLTCRKIYLLNSTGANQFLTVKREAYGNAYMTTYTNSTYTGYTRLMPEILSSTDGLTEIT